MPTVRPFLGMLRKGQFLLVFCQKTGEVLEISYCIQILYIEMSFQLKVQNIETFDARARVSYLMEGVILFEYEASHFVLHPWDGNETPCLMLFELSRNPDTYGVGVGEGSNNA